jgi:hypothetical protein
MIEHYFYFGRDLNEWLKMPAGHYPAPLLHSINLNGLHKVVFIYDEYENLLYTIPDALSSFKYLTIAINRKMKVMPRASLPGLDDINFMYLLSDMLDKMNYGQKEWAARLIENVLVNKGKALRRAGHEI